jgi:hypothetical protein
VPSTHQHVHARTSWPASAGGHPALPPAPGSRAGRLQNPLPSGERAG